MIAKFSPRANGKKAESCLTFRRLEVKDSDLRSMWSRIKFPLFCLGSAGIEIAGLQSVSLHPWPTKKHTSSGSTDVLGSDARAAAWDPPHGLQRCLVLTQPARITSFRLCNGTPWGELKLSWARKKKASVLSFLELVLWGGWFCFKVTSKNVVREVSGHSP